MALFDEDKQDKRLEELKHQEEEELVEILAQQKYGMQSVNLGAVPVENEALRYIPEEQAREMRVGPFKLLGKHIHIAVRTPEDPRLEELSHDLKEHGLTPHFYMASMASLEKVWGRYKELSQATSARVGGMDVSGEVIADLAKNLGTLADTKNEIERVLQNEKSHKVSHLLEVILASAIGIDASDVHIEPEEEFVRLRYRLDGVLQDIFHFTNDVYKLMNSRLKLMSGMKLTTNAMAQDGRFSIFLGGEEISMRVSVVPGAYGEGIVMRILNPKSIQVKLEDMGIQETLFNVMMRDIKKPNGLVLLTGPTGSGKTTTLYAFLRKIYSPELKMMTIEDPVEYHLEGITQTQVEHEKGYDFLAGLRAALRQDPDVLMVGEIRDSETAKIAVEAALTGHLVFSTLHTNNAGGVIPRLIDLDVNPKILVSALSLSVAQRLARKLCQVCKEEVKDPIETEKKLIVDILKQAEEQKKPLEKYGLSSSSPIILWKPVGCEKCNFTGYKGRIGIFEAIETDEAIEKIIPTNPSERDIKRTSIPQGMFDMKQDAIVKVLKGVTSLEEVASVVDLYEE
jgi:type IV pilus assembly protein PilB